MSFLATTTVTITRGETVDEYEDPVDSDTVVAEQVPMSILQTGRSYTRPVEGRRDVVRNYVGRMRKNAEFEPKKDDRLRCERTGVVYTIDGVTLPLGFNVGPTDWSLELRRVT